ncbi:hypothetical protein P7C71_g3784, partial [Lecanoromycetidae sp. Uapishka_2]
MVNLTKYNISIVLFVCLGAYSYGFSYAVFGTSIGEPGFYVFFNLNRQSAWIGYGTYFAKNQTVQWRMPLCLCPIAPLLLLIGIFWVPESPRWLIWDNQLDKAWDILQKIHHDPTDAQDLAAHAEYVQIEKQVAFDKETSSGYVQMFTIPSWRKRTLLAILVIFAVQSAGINGVTTYLIIEAEATGLTGSMPLLIYSIYVVVAVSVNFLNAAFLDKIGRKRMLLMGLAWTGLCLFAVTLLEWKYVGTANKQGNAAAIFFINLFAFGVGFFLDPTQFVYVAEIFPTTIRAKGLTISLFTYFVATILYTAPGPKAFKNIGQWYYLVFVGCDVVSAILLWKFMPETTGLSLEEMGALFGDTVVTHMTADGHGLVEVDAMAEFKNEGHALEIDHARNYDDSKVGAHQTTTMTESDRSV